MEPLGAFAGDDVERFVAVLQLEFADLANFEDWIRLLMRVVTALALGGSIGWNRQVRGKDAGLRTHMLVTLGSAIVVVAPSLMQYSPEATARVIQGVIAGIGFLGGGTILKLSDRRRIYGLTTAGTLWLCCGVGICVGLGRYGAALVATAAALGILYGVGWLESRRTNTPKGPSP